MAAITLVAYALLLLPRDIHGATAALGAGLALGLIWIDRSGPPRPAWPVSTRR